MIGTPDDPKLKLSGAETWGFVLFLTELLGQHGERFGAKGPQLREAGGCLIRIMDIFRGNSAALPPQDLQDWHG